MLTTAILLTLATAVAAHQGCGGHEIGRRNPGGPIIQAKRDGTSTSTSDDPITACTAYSYQPVLNIKASFPAIWQTASIVSGDTDAQSLFSTINATLTQRLPTDLPHGTSTGNWTGVNYNASDEDCWWTWKGCTTPATSTGLEADITTVPEPSTWGLGFDDGPNCSHNALYDVLRENNQSATMFFIGSNVLDWPLQALRAMSDGHQICVHTWSHQYMTSFSNEQAFAELYYAQKAIKDVLGVTPMCWRPPFGDVDNRIRLIASQLNMSTIVWSDDTEDWRANAPGQTVTEQDVTNNYQSLISRAKNGTYATHGPVVLNHELNNFTMSEFIQQYPDIKSAFDHVVPLCAALNISHPYKEQNYTCPGYSSYLAGDTNTSETGSLTATSAQATGTQGAAVASTSTTSGGREVVRWSGWVGTVGVVAIAMLL